LLKKIKPEGNSFFGFLIAIFRKITFLAIYEEIDHKLSQEPKILELKSKAFWNAQCLLLKIKYGSG
jgi:hypothetical protein